MIESFRISDAFSVRNAQFLTHPDPDASMQTVVPRKGITKGMRCASSVSNDGYAIPQLPPQL